MFKVQQNRYLWVHLVGLAAVPLLLDICLAGLASAGPASSFGFQFWMVALIGIVPSAWMQIQRPFYIYSLPPLAVKPSSLNESDRRCLMVLKSWQIKALAGLTAGFSLWLLIRLYDKLPQVLPVMTPGVGLVSAIAAFFFACLFLQISVSVVRSLLIGQDTLERVKPIASSEVASSFLIPGIRVNKILPTGAIAVEKPDVRQEEEAKVKASPPVKKLETELIKTEDTKETANSDAGIDSLEVEMLEVEMNEFSSEETEDTTQGTSTQGTSTQGIDTDTIEAAKQVETVAEDNLPVDPLNPSTEALVPENTEENSVPEDPPLVIPEIVESDDFDFNSNR